MPFLLNSSWHRSYYTKVNWIVSRNKRQGTPYKKLAWLSIPLIRRARYVLRCFSMFNLNCYINYTCVWSITNTIMRGNWGWPLSILLFAQLVWRGRSWRVCAWCVEFTVLHLGALHHVGAFRGDRVHLQLSFFLAGSKYLQTEKINKYKFFNSTKFSKGEGNENLVAACFILFKNWRLSTGRRSPHQRNWNKASLHISYINLFPFLNN